jgi:hypothetical protein
MLSEPVVKGCHVVYSASLYHASAREALFLLPRSDPLPLSFVVFHGFQNV